MVTTGLPGLDQVLHGGFRETTGVLVEGAPGTGKTTLGLQFLVAGTEAGEAGLYITFEELPDQLYKDAEGFAWDLPEMEQRGLLQVMTTSPDALLEEIQRPGGMVEEVVGQLHVRRLVIDSLAPLAATTPAETREVVYTLRSALKRLKLTALVLTEDGGTEAAAFTPAYLFDTWLHLTYRLQSTGSEGPEWRMRFLEVFKHRGSAFAGGQYVLRFTRQGLALAPHSRLPRGRTLPSEPLLPTGVAGLDRALGGGLAAGEVYTLEARGPVAYLTLKAAICARWLAHEGRPVTGDGRALALLGGPVIRPDQLLEVAGTRPEAFWQAATEGRFLLLDPFGSADFPEFGPYTLSGDQLSGEAFTEALRQKLARRNDDDLASRWLFCCDVTVLLAQGRYAWAQALITSAVALARRAGNLTLLVMYASQVAQVAGVVSLNTVSAGALITWSDGPYQYLQVVKTPTGHVSEPLVIVPTASAPFIDVF